MPVLFVAGNHEFDRRELSEALPQLRAQCSAHGITMLERDATVLQDEQGRRVRFLGTVRWCDFDLFGPARRDAAQRAGTYFQRVMQATLNGEPFDAAAVRQEALACRAWLAQALAEPSEGRWDATVVVTHFAPSLLSADPRYGQQNGTASFCNADDDLVVQSDLWLHGHLHCRHDYMVPRPAGGTARVVCQARGLAKKNEPEGFDPLKLISVFG